MILAALSLALSAQPTLLTWTNEAGREVSTRYRSEAACERARPAVERRMHRFDRRQARLPRRKLGEGYTPGPDGKLVVPPGWRMVPAVPLLPPPL